MNKHLVFTLINESECKEVSMRGGETYLGQNHIKLKFNSEDLRKLCGSKLNRSGTPSKYFR